MRSLRLAGGGVFLSLLLQAQTPNNQALNGKYFFRQVSLGTSAAGLNLTDPRSLLGTITFDGTSHFTYTAQLVQGGGAATPLSGSGSYAIDPAGFVSLDSPLRSGEKINARYSVEAIVGSTTESAGAAFDLFAAIPAPTTAVTPGSISGSYWMASLEFPGGSFATARNAIFTLNWSGQGKIADFFVNGHAANVSAGRPATQQVTGAAYGTAPDGTVSVSLGSGALVSGNKTLYLSRDGSILLGGSAAAGSHDFWIGVKAISGVSNTTWNASYWGAGLRLDSTVTGYAGAAAVRGSGKLYWTRRLKVLGVGTVDFTGINSYSLKADGSGTVELGQVALGAGGSAFVGVAISANDPSAYEIYFGAQMPTLTGAGVFLNPQGVVNGASFAPVGNPISPGQAITLYGTGLARSPQSATPPYPLTLNGVTVLVNGKPAPLFGVSPMQINALVPYATAGSSATIVVQSGGTSSNPVTVPVAPTSPGVFSQQSSGSGLGDILHADYTPVNAANPAVGGEIVLLFLTGLGTVDPAVTDGTAGGADPPSSATAPVTVLIGRETGTAFYSGLAPGYPGLYQINVQLPPVPPGVTTLPLALSTPNAYHDQVDIAVNP